jgi:levanase/fructan beta-fructosidase
MQFAPFPDMPFSQQITFPCELKLRKTASGLAIYRKPVDEVKSLHRDKMEWTDRTLHAGQQLPLAPSGRLFHIKARVALAEKAKLTFFIRGEPVVLTRNSIDSSGQKGQWAEPLQTIEILVDVSSIETFINDGELSSTRFVLPHHNGLAVRSDDGDSQIHSLEVHTLNSSWPSQVPPAAVKVPR